MNRLTRERQVQVLRCLVEGSNLRATVRITGVAMNTILKLLADVGKACTEYQDKSMRNLACKHIQCDEIWQFCYALHYMWHNFVRIHKTLRATPAMEAGIADHVWSFEELIALLDGKKTIAA